MQKLPRTHLRARAPMPSNATARLLAGAAASLVFGAITPSCAQIGVPIPPTLNGVIVAQGLVTVGGAVASPTLTYQYTAPNYLGAWSFTFTSPHGQTQTVGGQSLAYAAPYAGSQPPPPAQDSTMNISNETAPFGPYAEPGTWTMTSASLTDLAGNVSLYTQAQITALSGAQTITVVNKNKPDLAAPLFTVGKILNSTVSLASPLPFLGVQVTITSSLSGVQTGTLYVSNPSGVAQTANISTQGPAPVHSGAFQFGATLPQGAATGTWTITGYKVCSLANICATGTTPAAVAGLFGTSSFTVTN